MIWNGYPYIVPYRHIRPHIGFVAHLLAFEASKLTTTSGAQTADHSINKSLIAMMEIIEGAVPGKVCRIGKTMNSEGELTFTPPDLERNPSHMLDSLQRLPPICASSTPLMTSSSALAASA